MGGPKAHGAARPTGQRLDQGLPSDNFDFFSKDSPDHGSGDPYMNWDDKPLKESKVW